MIFIMAPEIHKTVLSNIKEKNSICPTINMAIKQKVCISCAKSLVMA